MADINNIITLQDLQLVIAEYLTSPRSPRLKGEQLNIILTKIIELVRPLSTDIDLSADTTINWQTDIIPGDTKTYAQKHGNKIIDVVGKTTIDGVTTKYSPGFSYTKSGGLITVVNITEILTGTITII